jgi:large subunit ribosomal protein L10
MRLEQKKQVVDELADKLERANIIITTSYRGLTVAEMTELRRKLRQEEIEYRVIKNNMARFAAERTGKESLMNVIEGPTAIAFGYGDIMAPAKALLDYIRSTKIELKVIGGMLEQRILDSADVSSLASMPPKEVLVAKLIGGLQGPIYGLVNILNANITNLLGVLISRKNQLEEGG